MGRTLAVRYSSRYSRWRSQQQAGTHAQLKRALHDEQHMLSAVLQLTGLALYRQSEDDSLQLGRFGVRTSVGARINLHLQTSPEVHSTSSTNWHLVAFEGVERPDRDSKHSLADQGQGLLILEVSRSHTTTHHSR